MHAKYPKHTVCDTAERTAAEKNIFMPKSGTDVLAEDVNAALPSVFSNAAVRTAAIGCPKSW